MTEEENIALFDAYNSGEMTQSEKIDFEKLLQSSNEFAKDFEAYKNTTSAIKSGAEYSQIKDKLKEIHSEIYSGNKSIFLQAKFYIPLAIAATITLVIAIIPFGSNNEMAVTEVDSAIQELSAEEGNLVDEASYMEEEVDEMDDEFSNPENYSQLDAELVYEYSKPKGGCFLISENGYFITAKHLVHKKKYIKLQQKDLGVAFNTKVIYRDSLLDFAILQCSEENAALFKHIPYRLKNKTPSLGDEVFTLGYPKSDIVYTKGSVSSENGFRSDSMTYQTSMPSNPGDSGSPLFSRKGDLVGIVIANNSKKQSVTYIIKPTYIHDRIQNLKPKFDIDMSRNYSKRYNQTSDLIKKLRPFVFELH